MTLEGVHGLGIVFALITGTAAGLLSLLTWEILKQSPFGRGVLVLSIAMFLFVGYHTLALVFPAAEVLLELVKSGLFTGVAVFILLLIVNEHRIKDTADTGHTR